MIDFLIKIKAFFVSLIPHWTVVVDTETTGIKDGEVLQVALITGTGRVLFNRFIKPDYATEWPEAQKINHISPQMVKHSRYISSYVPLINSYLKHTKTLIGYNHARFDLPLLEGYGISTKAKLVDIMQDDTDKRTKPGEYRPKWRKLTVTAGHYGYFFFAHDALEDCFATLHVNVFMHPGMNTILYFLRKIARIVAGVVWIGSCYEYSTLVPETDSFLLKGLPNMAIASWSYVYGPITGVISTYIGTSLYVADRITVLCLSLMAMLLGLVYGIIKSPRTWFNRVITCIAVTIIGGFLCVEVAPDIISRKLQILTLVNENPVSLVLTMVLGIPFYFLLNRYLKRVL